MGAWWFDFLSVDTQLAPMLSPEIVRVQTVELNKDLTAGEGSWSKLRTVCDHSSCLGEHNLNLEISAQPD